jgi:hypothetical protein
MHLLVQIQSWSLFAQIRFSIFGLDRSIAQGATMAGVLWVAARSRDLLAGGAASFALWRFNRPERPKAQLFHPEFFNLNGGAGEDSEGGGGGDVRVAKPQTAVVIGAGTVGVSLAYQLARRGYNVAVIDAASEVSAECSAAAAGGMARSNAIVSRGTWADVSSAIANSLSISMCMQNCWHACTRPFNFTCKSLTFHVQVSVRPCWRELRVANRTSNHCHTTQASGAGVIVCSGTSVNDRMQQPAAHALPITS